MTGDNDNGTALLALIDRTETVSKQVLALINLNAVLLREVSMAHGDPLEHFAKLEAEIGGLGEAIAMGTRNERTGIFAGHHRSFRAGTSSRTRFY